MAEPLPAPEMRREGDDLVFTWEPLAAQVTVRDIVATEQRTELGEHSRPETLTQIWPPGVEGSALDASRRGKSVPRTQTQ